MSEFNISDHIMESDEPISTNKENNKTDKSCKNALKLRKKPKGHYLLNIPINKEQSHIT